MFRQWVRKTTIVILSSSALVSGACAGSTRSTSRTTPPGAAATASMEVVASSAGSQSVETDHASGARRFVHRFATTRVRGDGGNQYRVITRPGPNDSVVALVSFDGALSIGGRRLEGGYRDFAVVKLNASGDVLWVYELPVTDEGQSRYANAFTVSSEGDVFVGGVFGAQSAGFSLMRLSSSGELQWIIEPTRGRTWSEVHDVAVDSSGNVVVAGHFSSRLTIEGLPSVRCSTGCGFVAAFGGADGDARWAADLRSPDGALVAVEITDDDDVIVAGHYSESAMVGEVRLPCRGELDLALARYTSEGALVWAVRHGSHSRDELVRMVPLTGGRVILQTRTDLFVASESDGSLIWQGSLQPGRELVDSPARRSRFWLASLEEHSNGVSTVTFSINEADGSVAQEGTLSTEIYQFEGAPNVTLSRRSVLLGGVMADRRWDAVAPTPFVARAPLLDALDGARFESFSKRGTEGGSRCAGGRNLPQTLDLFELRAGLEVVRDDVQRCGADLSSLRFQLRIAGDGTVSQARPITSMPMAQSVCVTEAIEQARFCPFFAASYAAEADYQ